MSEWPLLSCVEATKVIHREQCIGVKHNLYSEAIELVCGGSPIDGVLVERKAQLRGKGEQQQQRTSLDQLLVQHKCTVMGKMNGNYLQLPLSSLQGPSSLRGPPD